MQKCKIAHQRSQSFVAFPVFLNIGSALLVTCDFECMISKLLKMKR